MISAISITLLTVLSIAIGFGLLCTGAIFCCCALSSFNVFAALLCCGGSLSFGKRTRRHPRHNGGGLTYQNRNFVDASHNSGYAARPPTLVDSDLQLAEAYLVAPFAEARVINDNSPTDAGIHLTAGAYALENGDGAVQGRLPQMVFKDLWATILFLSQAFVIVYFAVEVMLASTKAIHTPDVQTSGLGTVVAAFCILGTVATLAGTTCLTFVLRNAEHIIEGVMWVNIGVCAIGAVLCLATIAQGGFLFAIALSLIAAVNYCYLVSVRPRIPFASAVLSVACQSIKDNYVGFITAAYLLLVVQLAWFLLWSIAAYGIFKKFLATNLNTSDDANKAGTDAAASTALNGGQVFLIFLLFLSLHWGSEVIRIMLLTTFNGVIGCWWFDPSRKAVVRGAMFRSVTTSFGSICFGSLIVSAIHALRELLNMSIGKNDRGNRSAGGLPLRQIASCLLGIIEQAMTYVNKYAYCYVAGYGMGFIESARKVSKLFSDRGWSAIINDNLVGNVLTFAVIGMTIVTALLGALVSLFLGPSLARVGVPSPVILLSVIGGLMGFAVSIILTNALSSGVSMVFVCLAENPDALKANHPREYFALTGAWDAFHTNITWARDFNLFGGPGPLGGAYPNGAQYNPLAPRPNNGGHYNGSVAAPYYGGGGGGGGGGGPPAHQHGDQGYEGLLYKGGATAQDSLALNPLHQQHLQQAPQQQYQQHHHQQQQQQQHKQQQQQPGQQSACAPHEHYATPVPSYPYDPSAPPRL